MIDASQIHALVTAAADGVVGVASRWDVIVAAFAGGFAREITTRRRERVAADERAKAIAAEAAEAAVVQHSNGCQAAWVSER